MSNRYSSGSNALGISDISGFRVKYKDMKSDWRNFRVDDKDFSIKHPQLTPARQINDPRVVRFPRPEHNKMPVLLRMMFLSDANTAEKLPDYCLGVSSIGSFSIEGAAA